MREKTAKYNIKFSKLKISCHHLPENANGLQGYWNNAIYHIAFAVCKKKLLKYVFSVFLSLFSDTFFLITHTPSTPHPLTSVFKDVTRRMKICRVIFV